MQTNVKVLDLLMAARDFTQQVHPWSVRACPRSSWEQVPSEAFHTLMVESLALVAMAPSRGEMAHERTHPE